MPFTQVMYQPINYFVRFGADRFKADPVACQMLVDFFTTAMASDRLGANDRGTACKIAESTLLHLRGYFDQVGSEIPTRFISCQADSAATMVL